MTPANSMGQLVAGRLPVLTCLQVKKRNPRHLYLLQGAKGLEAIRQAAQSVPIEECSRASLDRRAKGLPHQGAVLEAAPLPLLDADEWDSGSQRSGSLVVVLDGVEDPHNFGAIARSAAALGAHALLFGKDRAAPLSAVSLKSAAGAMEILNLVQARNLVRAIGKLKESGFWIAGLDASGDKVLWESDLTGQLALVIGGEGKGMRRLVRRECDLLLRIPLEGPVRALNASVSAGIALAESARQRRNSPSR